MSVYNAGPELRDTLDSILAQTHRDFEVIVVEDGSTTGDRGALDEYSARDTRVRLLRRAHNLGLTRSLIEGCAAARGTYIARHDAGDLSLPTRFEEQARVLDGGATFVSCATEYVGPALEPLWIASPSGATASGAAFVLDPDHDPPLLDGPTHHGSVMFRTDAYQAAGGYRAAFRYGQDFDLWYRLAAIGTFYSIPRVLYRARITPDSISSGARAEQQQLAALSLMAMRMRHRGESDRELLAVAAGIGGRTAKPNPARGLYFIGEALRRNRDPRARRYLRQAIAANPLFARAWFRLVQSAMLAR